MFRGVILSTFMAFAITSEGVQWKYGETAFGPEDWNKVSQVCSKKAQSPINIATSTVVKNPFLNELSFTCDNKNGKVSGLLTNNGHAPTFAIDKDNGTASLTGGPLGDSVFKLEQLHFHFGCENDQGSEHTVDGRAYSGELHLVTYNTKYTDFQTAVDKKDGLSVIGVFLEVNRSGRHKELKKLSRKMHQIRKADGTKKVKRLFLYELIPELSDLSKASFYSYKGSLTTPPCYQSVRWIVLKTPIAATKRDLKLMRRLLDHEEHSFCNNFRPTQPLNGRAVSET
ncbi:Eukaryotic-type carbonic anhydrase [Porites harrisoni]